MNKLLTLLITSAITLSAATFNVATTQELRTALYTAATDEENDTVILADGIYKTTADGEGTFTCVSNKANKLTLKGSSSKNVILSGDNADQILDFKTGEKMPLILENLTFVDGNNSNGNGGGVDTDYSIEVKDCNFTHNSAVDAGGGFNASGSATVSNSFFANNIADGDGAGFNAGGSTIVNNSKFIKNSSASSGGGFRSGDTATVSNSIFNNNSANYGGGFESYLKSKAVNSKFIKNSAVYYGGGFYSYLYTAEVISSTFIGNRTLERHGAGFCADSAMVVNSMFKDNNATYNGGGFYTSSSGTTEVNNSIFVNNNANRGGGFCANHYTKVNNSIFFKNSSEYGGGGFEARYLKASNILLKENSSGIYIDFMDNENGNVVINSIFLNNNGSDIDGGLNGSDVLISYLENNYIDTSKVTLSSLKKNNIFNGVNLGFKDPSNGDYNLTASSDLIDAGSTSMDYNITFPITDLNGNARVAGTTIDIGPYEFSATKPTINSITYTGEAKEGKQLTFATDYTLANGRTISKVEYDYENSGTWTTLNTHTYNTKGIYTINVKVTDSDGEFSTTTRTVTIAALPFSEMTDAQKLKKAIDPQYYDEIMKIINSNATLNSLTASKVDSMQSGWTLSGTSKEITDMSIFDNASIIWVYNNSAWSAYSSNATMAQKIQDANIPLITSIPADSGVWVYK